MPESSIYKLPAQVRAKIDKWLDSDVTQETIIETIRKDDGYEISQSSLSRYKNSRVTPATADLAKITDEEAEKLGDPDYVRRNALEYNKLLLLKEKRDLTPIEQRRFDQLHELGMRITEKKLQPQSNSNAPKPMRFLTSVHTCQTCGLKHDPTQKVDDQKPITSYEPVIATSE